MNYHSTRNTQRHITASEAIIQGLAEDGGLFVPDSLPGLPLEVLRQFCQNDYISRCRRVMQAFLTDFAAEDLVGCIQGAYTNTFDDKRIAPVRPLDDSTSFLELWHGPTCAFKDMALQVLPRLLSCALQHSGQQDTACILVATSGDTGKAALEGFRDVPGTKIFVFYPENGVSKVQKLQMTTQLGDNVGVCAVKGNFDDAQSGVKAIFADEAFSRVLLRQNIFLSSANSINWGRLLPQIVYYISGYCDLVNAGRLELGEQLNVCVPTGNFGNILAAWYAKRMGLPLGRLICASNANNVLTDFFNTGTYDRNRPFHQTISPSMDILVSSNLERLLHALGGEQETQRLMSLLQREGRYTISQSMQGHIREDFSAGYADDTRTRAAMAKVYQEANYVMDPHTAVAYDVLQQYREQTGDTRKTLVVSTASPFKFAADVCRAIGIVEPDARVVKRPLVQLYKATNMRIPAPLRDLTKREVRFTESVARSDMLGAVRRFLSE